jgi:glycosyltransferase involved in cell wall biosynthesis
MLESICRAAGLRVGLYTSPHLISFRERVQVNRHLIDEMDLVEYVRRMQELLKSFPAQASEAIAAKVPLVLSRIEVVKERIIASGLTEEDCGLLLFDPGNEEECADMITRAINEREAVLSKQQKFAQSLFSYTWTDAAKTYYALFFGKKD